MVCYQWVGQMDMDLDLTYQAWALAWVRAWALGLMDQYQGARAVGRIQ